MIEVTIGKRKYLHPSKIEEVTLDQWINITSKEDDIEAFSAFSGIPLKVLRSAPKVEVQSHMFQLSLLFEDVKDKLDDHFPESFKVGRSTYYPNQDLDNADYGQYLDCTHYMKAYEGRLTEFYPYMMAIYCLRKGEKYEDIDLENRAKEMRKAMALDAVCINNFFLFTSKDYAKDCQHYFQEK